MTGSCICYFIYHKNVIEKSSNLCNIPINWSRVYIIFCLMLLSGLSECALMTWHKSRTRSSKRVLCNSQMGIGYLNGPMWWWPSWCAIGWCQPCCAVVGAWHNSMAQTKCNSMWFSAKTFSDSHCILWLILLGDPRRVDVVMELLSLNNLNG